MAARIPPAPLEGADAGRGRQAHTPGGIPWSGWKDILWRVRREIRDDRVVLVAAGVTFYVLLAFVPALTALVSIYGFFADPATVNQHLAMLEGIVPEGGMQVLEEQLTRLTQQGRTTLGVTSLVSIGVALWSTNAGVKALFEGMNVAYDEKEERSFVRLNLISLAFTLGIIVAVLLFLGLAVVLPLVLRAIGMEAGAGPLVRIGSFAGVLIVLLVALACLYRWGPSRRQARWRWITPGAVLTIVVTLAASVLFSWYVANFGSYNATYGSLGAIVGFMVWIWITLIILIVGAELNAEAEHQTARDSTTGAEKPMGQRGAHMADTLGGTRADCDPGDSEATDTTGRSRRLSAGKLAIALPLALTLAWMERRAGRRKAPGAGS